MDVVRALADDDQDKYPRMTLRTSRFARWWTRPIAVSIAHDLLVMSNTYVAAAGAADAAEAMTIWKEWENHSLRNRDLRFLGSPVIGNLNSQYQAVFYRREAAVALAARMFQLKYGRDAKTADELVPEFLAEAPLDPLFGNGVRMPVHPTSQPARR